MGVEEERGVNVVEFVEVDGRLGCSRDWSFFVYLLGLFIRVRDREVSYTLVEI